MSCEDDKYPVNSKDLVGGYVRTRDKSNLLPAAVEMTILADSIESPAATGVNWVTPSIASQFNAYTVKAEVLIGPGTSFVLTVGRYRVWYRINDNPAVPLVPSPDTFKVV